MKEYDVFRDSYMRYLGYANEVGEAFRPLISRQLVNASYAVAIGYVFADTYDKSTKMHQSGADMKKVGITAGDVLIWQMLASVVIPGFTINRITWLSARLLRQAKMRKELVKTIPTAIGLSSIPLIIRPIDEMVDHAMDRTYRKWFA